MSGKQLFYARSGRQFWAYLGLALLLWLWLGPRAQAADLTVTSTADSGAGSLRQALADAMNGDTITFASALSGATITLSSAPLTVNKTVSINGAALPLALTLSGNNAKALFSVGSSGVLTLTRLTLANGNGNYGGALYNGGTLTLDRVTLTNNNALSGGAIYTVGTLTIRNSTLNGNRAFSGGAIDNYGALTIHNSTFSGNHANNTGGGLFNAGTLYLYNALLADSSSGGDCLNANDPFFGLVGVIAANVRTLTEDGSCGAALSGDPKLAALALSNGALVHEPTADSPALDAGDSATCLTVDQRGNARPQGAGCDLGAVEVSRAAPLWGDCNGDQRIDAGDLSATGREIFDGDGTAPQNAPGGSFAGTEGCNSNRDTRIDAGDVSCTARLIFNRNAVCGAAGATELSATDAERQWSDAELILLAENPHLILFPFRVFVPVAATE